METWWIKMVEKDKEYYKKLGKILFLIAAYELTLLIIIFLKDMGMWRG